MFPRKITEKELEMLKQLPPPTPWWMWSFGLKVENLTRGLIDEDDVIRFLEALDPSKIGRQRRAWYKLNK